MAKLYFYYSAMNAGKSTLLLQSSYNYQERGMDTLLFTPAIDNRTKPETIASRIGLSADASIFKQDTNLFEQISTALKNNTRLKCILVDEAHFLTKKQVAQLSDVSDQLNLPVLAYG
ncbi:MAG: AAA family ATPase, partial [Gammaproteobacteria bacterium]|nr:AAA family ATPase [Gammaproteobacteria bacterium]